MRPAPVMETLWAGWRAAYIESVVEGISDECLFCELPGRGEDPLTHILERTERAYSVLNTYPYTSGHLMVAPFRHVANPGDLEPEEQSDVWRLLARAQEACVRVLAPHGFNLGANLGRAAGAGVLSHLHVHLVPRWEGDANFMTSTANARVLPEALDVTWSRLREALDGL